MVSAGIYLFKTNTGNATAMCESRSKLVIKTLKRRQRPGFGYFITKYKLPQNATNYCKVRKHKDFINTSKYDLRRGAQYHNFK